MAGGILEASRGKRHLALFGELHPTNVRLEAEVRACLDFCSVYGTWSVSILELYQLSTQSPSNLLSHASVYLSN